MHVLLCLGVAYYCDFDCVEEFDCNAWGAEHPALWMLSDSRLPFNLAATHWWFLWDSLRLAFPTVLWLEGDWESGWSQSAGLLIVCLQISVKISEWQRSNPNCCVFTGKMWPFCIWMKYCIEFDPSGLKFWQRLAHWQSATCVRLCPVIHSKAASFVMMTSVLGDQSKRLIFSTIIIT